MVAPAFSLICHFAAADGPVSVRLLSTPAGNVAVTIGEAVALFVRPDQARRLVHDLQAQTDALESREQAAA